MHAHIYLHIHYATLHYTALHYIYILLHCIGLRYTRLHCIALYCIAFAFYKRTSTHTKRSNGTFTENLGQRRPMMGADHAGSWGFLSAQEDFWYLDRSVVELYMAMTGGTDWVVQYEVPRVRRVRMRVADVETFHLFCHRTKVTKCTLRYNGKSLINGGFSWENHL